MPQIDWKDIDYIRHKVQAEITVLYSIGADVSNRFKLGGKYINDRISRVAKELINLEDYLTEYVAKHEDEE